MDAINIPFGATSKRSMEIENSIAVVARTEIPRLSPVDPGRPPVAARPLRGRRDGRQGLTWITGV